MSKGEIAQALDDIWAGSFTRNWIYGRLGHSDTDTVEAIDVRGRPGYVYVSMGMQGDGGISIAKNKVNAAKVVWQQVKMRRELGELVIHEASSYSGGGGNGGGADSFFELSDVQPTGWDTGEVPTWDSATGLFKPLFPGGGGAAGTYLPGDGINILGPTISVKPNANRGIVVDSTGVGVHADPLGGLRAWQDGNGLYIYRDVNSGLIIDSEGISVGAGEGIKVEGNLVSLNVASLYDPMRGLTDDGNNHLQIKLGTDSGLAFGGSGGLLLGEGNGIDTTGNLTSVRLATDSGLDFGPSGGLLVGLGDGLDYEGTNAVAVDVNEIIDPLQGLGVTGNDIRVKLAVDTPSGLAFEAAGGLYVGEGDGINVAVGSVAVNVTEIINTMKGVGHDGFNNITVELEPDSGLDYAASGKLMLGIPGTLDVFTQNTLIDDAHFHQILTSSNPGPGRSIMATDVDGGFRFDTNLLYVDAANNRVGINREPTSGFGSATLDVIAANNADHTQRIQQKTGQTGRMWRIEDTGGNELIVLDSVGNLQSGKPGFVSGLTGWQITPQGNAEFNNIWARGELHATVFVKDEVHATGGTFMVATAATFFEDAILNDSQVDDDIFYVDSAPLGNVPLEIVTTSASFVGTTLHVSAIANRIRLNHPPSGPAVYFQPGEILRVKTEIMEPVPPDTTRLADVWLIVNFGTVLEDYGEYSVQKVSGSNVTIPKGTAIVTYGLPGDGAILMTSDWRPASNDEGYAPYIDIFTTGQQPWLADDAGITPHVRLGQLKGVGLPGLSGINKFGLVAGSDLADANSAYMVASEDGVEIYRGVIRLNNGANDTGLWDSDGNFRLGQNISQDATTGFRVITTGPDAGDVIIGDQALANYLKWNQSDGALLVSGSLQVAGGGEFASQQFVRDEDDITRGEANAYTDQQIAAINVDVEGYADSRRVLAVDAIFTSPAYNVITWNAFNIYYANNTSRTVAANAAYTLSASYTRFWAYIDNDQVGTLTLQFATAPSAVDRASFVLLAVVVKGISSDPASRAGITVVAGSTYISGSNIFTGSILTNQIAAEAITGAKIAAEAITAYHLQADTLSTINGQNVKSIEGVIVPIATPPGPLNQVTWSTAGNILRVTRGNNTLVTVLQGSRTIVGREYAYILNGVADTTNYTLQWYTPGSSTLPSNAIVIAVCEAGAKAASAIMTQGGVVISGDDIVAGSIVANNIAANTITAGQIAGKTITSAQLNDTVYDEFELGIGDASLDRMAAITVASVNANLIPHPTTAGRVDWQDIRVRFVNGLDHWVGAGSYTNAGAVGTRVYFYFLPTDADYTVLRQITPLASVPANAIVLAVVEKLTISSTVTMVNGGVVISGNSIVAQSITGTKIAANTISAGNVTSDFFISNNAQSMAVTGTFTSVGPRNISWSSASVIKASGAVITITDNSNYQLPSATVTTYLYILQAAASPATMQARINISAIEPGSIMVAICQPGPVKATIIMCNGGVLISGDDILADTINGNRIIAGTVEADRINAIELSALSATTGNLTIGYTGTPARAGTLTVTAQGKIYSSGKTAYADTTPGFFLGYDAADPAGYKFDIGSDFNYFRWNGSNFVTRFTDPIKLIPTAANGEVFFLEHPTTPSKVVSIRAEWNIKSQDWVAIDSLLSVNARANFFFITVPQSNQYNAITFDATQVNAAYTNRLQYSAATDLLDWDGTFYTKLGIVIGQNLDVQGDVIRLRNPSVITHSEDPGNVGDMRFDHENLYFYVPQGPGDPPSHPPGWRKISFGADF